MKDSLKTIILLLAITCLNCYADIRKDIAGFYRDVDRKGDSGRVSIDLREKGSYIARQGIPGPFRVNSDGSFRSDEVVEEGTWEVRDGKVCFEMKRVLLNGKEAPAVFSPITHILKLQGTEAELYLIDPDRPEVIRYRRTA